MQGLQVISGKYKGRKIYTLPDLDYRPTKSRVRKSLFDHLGDLNHMDAADLFSGSGIMGIEAASRGATHVALVEKDRKKTLKLEENLKNIGIPEVDILNKDVFQFLKEGHKFDLIIADPPYGWIRDDDNDERINTLINDAINCLSDNGLFILEAPKGSALQGSYSKQYGDTKLIFWRKK